MTYKHPATAVGWSLLQAADAAAARAAIGIDASTATATNQYAATIGNGSATSIAVTHGLGTRDVVVSVYDVATGEQVECDVVATTGNVVTLTFATAPATNTLRCVVLGTAFGLGASGATTSGAITDATTVGRQVLTAASGAAARTAMGAGTSNLAIGTTSLTAKAGDYQPSSANISDATAVGRSVITAASAAAARTAIGAAASIVNATGVTATDASSLSSSLSANSVTRAEGGIYTVTKAGATIPANKSLIVGQGSKLKLANNQLDTFTSGAFTSVVTLSDSTNFVGTIDGNRDGQDDTAFNAATVTREFHNGILALGTAEAPLRNLYVDATIENVVETPARFTYVEDSYIRIRAKDCGGAIDFNHCKNLTIDIEYDSCDNQGWRIFPSAVNISDSSNIRGRVVITNQSGEGSTLSADASWNVGLTLTACSDISFDEVIAEFIDDDTQERGLGCSFIGVQNMHVSRLRIVGYSNGLLELGGVVDSSFSQLDLDGRYQMYPDKANPSHDGFGITIKNNSFRAGWGSMSPEYTKNVVFSGGSIRRCTGEAVAMYRTVDTTWIGVRFESSWKGLATTDYLWGDAGYLVGTPSSPMQIRGHTFIGCTFSWNERSGIDISDGLDMRFIKCRAQNNSQAAAFGVCRLGLTADTSTAGARTTTSTSKTGLILDVDTSDTQSSTAPGYLNPAEPRTIYVDQAERYAAGQTITITNGATGPVDLVARVDDVYRDQITIDRDITNFPAATGLAGTISTSGTAVTGSGTSFLTEFVGTAWIEVGGVFRRVLKVADNTHATLESAFPTDVTAGTALAFRRTDIVTAHTQRYGFNLSADTVAPVIPSIDPTGNVTAALLDAASGTTRAATTSGTETLANKTLTSPVLNGAVINNWMVDSNEKVFLYPVSSGSSANNYLGISNAIAGQAPTIYSFAGGGTPDTDVSLSFRPKGSGLVNLSGDASQAVMYLKATSSAAAVNLDLLTKGAGVVTANSVPVVTTTGTQTLTNKTLTTPVLSWISATNGTTALQVNGVTGGADYLRVTNCAANGFPILDVNGSGTNNDLVIQPRGTGNLCVRSGRSEVLAAFSQSSTTLAQVNTLQFYAGYTNQAVQIRANSGVDSNVGIDLAPKGSGTVTINSVEVVTKSIVYLNASGNLLSVNAREYFYQLGASAVPTLPTAVNNTSIYHLKATTTTPILVTTTLSQTIDGGLGYLVINPYESYTLVSDNTGWLIY